MAYKYDKEYELVFEFLKTQPQINASILSKLSGRHYYTTQRILNVMASDGLLKKIQVLGDKNVIATYTKSNDKTCELERY